jgi:formylmethanofuran dehydrogenase subunit E
MQVGEKQRTGPCILDHSFDEYLGLVKSFHGHIAPGMILGGFMVDLAYRHLPGGEFFDALCETTACLPDAIQILTPCTIGNGWLKIIDIGRFALTFYEKQGGLGVRVYVDPLKLVPYTEIKNWFFKRKPKKEQNRDLLLAEMGKTGSKVCGFEKVRLDPDFIRPTPRRGFALCPKCHESFPLEHGPLCLGCQGKLPYLPVRQHHSQA